MIDIWGFKYTVLEKKKFYKHASTDNATQIYQIFIV